LFFDLVYVLAVTQLTHRLLEHLSVRGAFQTLLLLMAVWWAWIDTAWFTNWFDPDRRAVRLVLLVIMLISLIMSATLPEAFDDRGFAFAAALAVMQAGRAGFVVAVLGGHPNLRRNFQRILVWRSASGLVWLAGGLAEGSARETLWLIAVLIDLTAAACGFYTPGLGRSQTSDWTIAGEHMAERCRLIVILALGESILVTGANFGELPSATKTVVAFVIAFIGSVTLWWIYFDRADEAARDVIVSSGDPGRLGRSAYTYFHVPIIAGIIVSAAADEIVIAHPADGATSTTAALILGGPMLYLAGIVLFKQALWRLISWPRVVAIGALVLLTPLAAVSAVLALSAAATAVLVGLALWDAYREAEGGSSDEATSNEQRVASEGR